MYVLVRQDLTKAQQAVQGGHALARFLLDGPTQWPNGTLIYLGVKNEIHLKKWMYKLEGLGIKYKKWMEPDMNNQFTALAAYAERDIFRRLNCI